MIIRALIIIPYIMGAVASFFFYIKKDTKPIYKYLIVIASIFGIFRMSYTLYGILMYADHLYSAVYLFRELLTILIYVLFIYQMIVLSIRRKQAVF